MNTLNTPARLVITAELCRPFPNRLTPATCIIGITIQGTSSSDLQNYPVLESAKYAPSTDKGNSKASSSNMMSLCSSGCVVSPES